MEKDERRKLMQKVVSRMKFFPLELVYVVHDANQTPFHIFSVSFMPDGSVRYTLRNGEMFTEVTEQEINSEPNAFFMQEELNEE